MIFDKKRETTVIIKPKMPDTFNQYLRSRRAALKMKKSNISPPKTAITVKGFKTTRSASPNILSAIWQEENNTIKKNTKFLRDL